ncbi:MAG: twin-arginine translocase TatA/TatE family subunit [Aigarchaeota archaeon]|nr:twin-arginine translocase TatA/TatE family subunit [Aigarchaeota archaeon]MCX8193567.1 twin-arginine translocase TatA/TatE family subunit [Nitrososphaeria archaeon]MDW7986707.1 twin-arginine translocase TatA/TatE family subunit [Nitrososphaerota archaeon]
MAVEGVEWLFIALIIIIFVLWAPEKIPKIAEALGKARREFEKASKELYNELEKEAEVKSLKEESDEKIIEIAKSLGIVTEGKTRDEIVKEIIEKATSREHQVKL